MLFLAGLKTLRSFLQSLRAHVQTFPKFPMIVDFRPIRLLMKDIKIDIKKYMMICSTKNLFCF